jgi:lipopolysaccharide transport system ATP-binding protein
MVYITAKNISIVYPLLSTDRPSLKSLSGSESKVGGRLRKDKLFGIVALENFSISLKSGDRLGIFGHNGSGKTTLLRVLGGIYPPTSGSIEINGSTAGMYSLSLGVNKEATGLENIFIKGLMHGLKPAQIKELIPEIAEFSELGDYLNLPVKTYSSGMIMRLMFSTVSLMKPDILLLDEWVSTGDTSFRKKVDYTMKMMLDQTPIVIIASHNEKRLSSWSNQLVRMEKGAGHVIS